MKTPDEIKKGLSCHGWTLCDKECPYGWMKGTGYDCSTELCGDALIYIEQLETKCHQLERERDAAVADIRNSLNCCRFCTYDDGMYCKSTPKPLDNSCFEWRGVKEE